jgi:hypothetical protein
MDLRMLESCAIGKDAISGKTMHEHHSDGSARAVISLGEVERVSC